ncbi:MAG: Rpn family recombination-promoting nuclease/putative transposase, partial [Thermoguttaceae bacterium]
MPPKKKKTKLELSTENREQMLKDFRIRPNSDIFFATYFSDPKHESTLVNLINAVLTDSSDPPIVSAEVLNPFNIKKFAVDKSMILDVRAKDEGGRIFDIEIQMYSHLAFKERMLGYWADTYSGQLFRGDDYISLKPVVSIIIVFDDIFPELKNRHQLFHLVSDENPKVLFSEHICIHVLCLKGVGLEHLENIHDWNDALQGWSLFFSCEPEELEEQMSVISTKNPVLSDVGKEFRRYSSNPEMREIERSRMLYEAFHRLELGKAMEMLKEAEATAATSEAKGEARGKAEGTAEGIAIGEARKIARLLERRFDNVPSQLNDALLKIADLDKLDELFDFALDCQTL